MDSQDDQRRRHIDGFVDGFVDPQKRERYRSLLINPKKRSKITNRLNHNIHRDFLAKWVVAAPPRFSSNLIAYLISDCRELDDRFIEAVKALELVEMAYFGTVASIIPGILVAVKPEAPASVLWLHRPKSRQTL